MPAAHPYYTTCALQQLNGRHLHGFQSLENTCQGVFWQISACQMLCRKYSCGSKYRLVAIKCGSSMLNSPQFCSAESLIALRVNY